MPFTFLVGTKQQRFWIKLHPLHAIQCILKFMAVVRLLFGLKRT